MVEIVKAYGYQGRHRASDQPPLGAVMGRKVIAAVVAVWEFLREAWAGAGLVVAFATLIVMLMQANSTVIHQPTVLVPASPAVVTLPTPFPVSTSAVNT